MDQENLQRWENAGIFSDGTNKIEVHSKQGTMVGWTVWKDGRASKVMLKQRNWESKTYKARARSHTGHRDTLKQSLVYIDDDIQFPI